MGGDGNDGYKSETGVYYQVYSPVDPDRTRKTVAKKFKEDFMKLKTAWDHISNIKGYNFVFNNKFQGSNIVLEHAKSELERDYPNINFKSLYLCFSCEDI